MTPTRDYLLVELVKGETSTTETGIVKIVTFNDSESVRRARILQKGPAVTDPAAYPNGTVFFLKGTGIALGDGKYLVSFNKDVIATA